jgi:peptidoglycan/xylan/chitin deacetylase (PgdA/CDA1 family)
MRWTAARPSAWAAFDDGPSPFTDRLLYVLNAKGAKATFFMIGNKVALDPAAAKRIADAGMEIGSHTWEHPNISHLLGARERGSSYGGRENGPTVNAIRDIPAGEIPTLPATPSPKPAPNLPITDLPNQNPGGPQ